MNAICIVCRKPVTPETGVALGVAGKPLPIIVHREACLEEVRVTARVAVKQIGRYAVRGLASLLEGRAPTLARGLRYLSED